MTLKEQRCEQLDALKETSTGIVFCVEILIREQYGAFVPFRTLTFATMEEAQSAYDRLEAIYYPAYVTKYAKILF